MTKGKLRTALSTLLLALTASVPAPSEAAETGARTRTHHHRHSWHHRHIVLPAERHVIEITRPTASGYFVINGRSFSAMTETCARWAAGERITLVSGDWNGACSSAVFYNARRRQVCEMWCR
jgi:hypothetical protein